MAVVIERDALFGEVQIEVDGDAGTVVVRGAAVPTAVLRRRDGARADAHSPIRSRDGAGLDLVVDDTPASIRPGPGRLTRSSYRVDVDLAGRSYRLVADDRDRSVLSRGGERLGQLWAVADDSVSATWDTGREIEATDAALGYLLAAAYGTGGQHVVVSFVQGLFNGVP